MRELLAFIIILTPLLQVSAELPKYKYIFPAEENEIKKLDEQAKTIYRQEIKKEISKLEKLIDTHQYIRANLKMAHGSTNRQAFDRKLSQ